MAQRIGKPYEWVYRNWAYTRINAYAWVVARVKAKFAEPVIRF